MRLAGLLIQRMACLEDGRVLAGMPLRGADVTDAAMAMVMVVPLHEGARPLARRLQVGKALVRELGTVLGRAEQRAAEASRPATACLGPGAQQFISAVRTLQAIGRQLNKIGVRCN